MTRTQSGASLKLVLPAQPPEVARKPRIALVIPAYNEEGSIEAVLHEIHSLRPRFASWELLPIVVNDGSTDRTEAALMRSAQAYGARFVSLPLNLGIGRAVQTGFRMAVRLDADVTLQIDGDGQHPPGEIGALVEPILSQEAEVVVGSRYLPGASGNVSTPLRQVGTLFFSGLLRALVGVRIKDTTSGFRAFSFEATEFLSRYYPDDYPEVEAYVPLARRGFTIAERPVQMRPRQKGRSSITALRGFYYMIKVAFATAIDLLRPLPERRSREKTAGPQSGGEGSHGR